METFPRGDVLVVADDQVLRDRLVAMLDDAGYSVGCAATGESALALVRAQNYDVALVVLGERGRDVIAQVRGLQPDLEAVAITDPGSPGEDVGALDAGAYDCIGQPFTADGLIRVVAHAAERRRLRRAALDHQALVETLSMLHAVARASASSLLIDDVVDAALSITLDRLGADGAAVGFPDPTGGNYARSRSTVASSNVACLSRAVLGTDSLAAEVVLFGEAIDHTDIGHLPGSTAAALASAGYVSVWLVPIASAGQALGTLLAAWRTAHPSDAGELAVLRAIGEEIGPAIQNARLHAQATLHAKRLRAMHEVVRAISGEHDLEPIIGLLAARAVTVVGATDAALLLPAEDGSSLVIRALHGDGWDAPIGNPSPIVGSLNGLVYRAGQALTSTNLSTDPRLFAPMRYRAPDGPAAIVPLLHHGATRGTLCVVDQAHPDRSFTEEDLVLLGMLAEHGAVAIDNARLHASERAQNAVLEARVDERTSALRQAQEQLVRKERLTILGRMAGSVSHEIRNPLAVLRNSLYFLRTLLAPKVDDEALRVVEVMESEVHRANGIVSDLLDYARVRAPVLRPVSLPAVLSRAQAGISLPVGMSVVRDFAPDAPHAMADSDLLLTVFINLVRNAVQAMTSKGTLTLRVVRVGGKVVAEVEDTGPGIAPEIRDKLFEPLVTTKTKGLGLGLATARNLIEIQHGTLSVGSAEGGGARFRAMLPAAP